MNKRRIVILDSNSLLNRAFYALPPMTTSKGQPTGAIYGFTNMLLKIINDIKPDYIAAAFDRKAPTFRHLEYQDYKAGRKKMPQELAEQFEPVKELLKAFNIGIYEKDGYEADDILGTIARRFESDEMEVIIFTGDRDALQLVSDYTKVMITKKGITDIDVYDKKAIKEKYGLLPEGIVDLKGLMGDASDNIPGVAGVGEKTALKLLQEYHTLENIYENLNNITAKKLNENLTNHKDEAFLSKRLATIDRSVPIEVDLEAIKAEEVNAQKVKELFSNFEFKSLIDKVHFEESTSVVGEKYELPEITELSNFNVFTDCIKGKKELNYVLVLKEKNLEGIILEGGYYISKDNISFIKDVMEDINIIKNTINAKSSYTILKRYNIEVENISFDAKIAAYLLNPSESKYDMMNLLNKYAGILAPEINENKALIEGIIFANNLEKLKSVMTDEIEKYGMTNLLEEVEMPLVKVLASMEDEGFRVDRETLNQIGFELSEEIDSLTAQIYDLAGEEFNINSPKQLGNILFERLNLPVIKKTKTGYSTDAEVLEELSEKHEIVDKILNFRQLVKLKSTYVEGLLNSIHKDGKIHSSFNQTVTATGRISSTEPNLQNIPIKMEQGRRIRKAFVPESEDYVILSADYSQIELRVLAHISSADGLIDAFKSNQDIHRRTASEVFGVTMEEVTSLQRSRAKAVNFGIVYGLSDYGLSRDLKITRKEAKNYIENYFNTYTGVKAYMDRAIASATEKGYVETLLNRIRHIPEINASNKNVKALGERLAMNTPIQGSAADIIKIAMVRVFESLKSGGFKSKLILQVHDELVLEVHRDEIDEIKELVKRDMEGALKLSVPLEVDISYGTTWYDAK